MILMMEDSDDDDSVLMLRRVDHLVNKHGQLCKVQLQQGCKWLEAAIELYCCCSTAFWLRLQPMHCIAPHLLVFN